MSEIEIKFVTRDNALPAFVEKVLPAFEQAGFSISREPEMRLQNDYYDTADHLFQQEKMGFRVRGNNDRFEQTMKTHGKVSGGLHERAEYNVALDGAEPDLRLFPVDVWPDGWQIEQVNDKLQRQFSTHFVRTAFDVEWDGACVEVVIDEGEASTGKNSSPIHEIELELKQGEVTHLFTLAKLITENTSVRLSDVSKAAQGYQLLNGLSPVISQMQPYLKLEQGTTTEEAFCRAVQQALSHWQKHEHLYFETGSVKMLGEIVKGARLLLQTVSLYLPVLQCPQLLSVHQLLMKYMQVWLWQDDLQSLRYLLSKKSLFNKCLSRYPALTSYLQGRKAGLIHAHTPDEILYSKQTNTLKVLVAQLLQEKPWRQHSTAYSLPVMEHAQGWLSQGWQTVQQTMPGSKTMTPENYLAIGVLLRQTLWNGFLLADLFDEERHHFRAPWLDILTGIDELKALMMLRALATESELDELSDVFSWVDDKIANLMHVMERTRQAGMQGDVYWQAGRLVAQRYLKEVRQKYIMLHRYTLFVLVLLYLVVLVQFFREKHRVSGAPWVLAAMIVWPFILTDEWLRAFGQDAAGLSVLTVFTPLLSLTLLYRSVKLLVIDNARPSKLLLWLPVALALLAEIPLLFVSAEEKAQWLISSPTGHPLDNWHIYLVYMVTGFGILVLGILITELIQNYHRYLSSQVADVREFRVQWLGGAMGVTVGLAFCCILLVTAGAFGFFDIHFWQSLFNVLFAIALLQTFIAVIRPQHTSPSPLDYHRLDDLKAEQCIMREALVKAEQTMTDAEAFKSPGLQLKAFAGQCHVDPTTLVIALRLLEKRDFRSFVYQYRLTYAKNELLGTDDSLAAQAKRLGVHSEQFLSGVMMNHMRKQRQSFARLQLLREKAGVR